MNAVSFAILIAPRELRLIAFARETGLRAKPRSPKANQESLGLPDDRFTYCFLAFAPLFLVLVGGRAGSGATRPSLG